MQSKTNAAIGARFGQPAEWAHYHTRGQHICVDGKTYVASCLITDSDMDGTARYFMHRGHGSGATSPA